MYIAKIIVFVLTAFIFTAPALAVDNEVTAAVFTWNNMGEMAPEDVSKHYVSVSRASDVIQHSIEYSDMLMAQKTTTYKTEDNARFSLFNALGDAVKCWESDYYEEIMDGSSWRVVISYADGSEKEFNGYGKTPPDADKIKNLILALADFKTRPLIF